MTTLVWRSNVPEKKVMHEMHGQITGSLQWVHHFTAATVKNAQQWLYFIRLLRKASSHPGLQWTCREHSHFRYHCLVREYHTGREEVTPRVITTAERITGTTPHFPQLYLQSALSEKGSENH
ncbi:unnamed protein product [Arctogadus glacialis]